MGTQASEKATHKASKGKSNSAKRNCIMVLGMHRSGTSALTRAISLLGAELPKNLLGANPTNPAGHWEPLRLMELHHRMLHEGGSSWDDWRSFDPNDLGTVRLRAYKAEIARIIDEEYGNAPLTVLKEPCIARFVPLYRDVLNRMRIEVRYVLIARNPLAVAASLERRGNFTYSFSALLWLRHVLEAEYATRDQPRVFVSYEAMLDDWHSEVGRITDVLKIEWPQPISSEQTALSAHFSVELQHHVASRERLEADPRIARWVKDTYSSLMTLESDPGDIGAMAQLDAIRGDFDRYSSIFGEAFFSEMHARVGMEHQKRSQIQHLADRQVVEVETSKDLVKHLEASTEALSREMAAIREQAQNSENEITQARVQLGETFEKIRGLQEELEAARGLRARC